MGAKRLTVADLDKRVRVKLDKSIKADGVNGIMIFGEKNDYPQLMEMAVNGSVTAKAAASVYSKFLAGEGFTNPKINDIVVGKDQRGKNITMLSLLRQATDSVSVHNGFYIHRNTNLENTTGTVHLKPFKDGRFASPDDSGFSAKIMFYNNWEKDGDTGKFAAKNANDYHIFTGEKEATQAQIEKSKENFKGQVYFQFFDNQYFYPLSVFDASYMDVDTEQQLSLYKNRQCRNGFFDKTIIRKQKGITKNENGEDVADDDIADELISFVGTDGESLIVIEDDIDPDTGEFPKNSFQVEKIEGNVDDKLFENWEKGLANSIRKCPRNIPNLLIEISDGMFSGQSGEAIKQATSFYNAMTRDDRALISASFKEIFSLSDNPELKNNIDWTIKPLTLIQEDEAETVDQAEIERLKAQATLKGSVGGVTALITLQQSVAAGTADLSAAIEIVKEIYGISEDIAIKMIGTPKEI